MKDAELNKFLIRHNLAALGEEAKWTPLAGGVSSDIWRVDLQSRALCVKRALANLKVTADWQAPIERNNYEWEWFNFVYHKFPEVVPQPVAHDREMQMLAMEFLAPEKYKLWKTELLNGAADEGFAATVGMYLGKIHASSANDSQVKETFATDKLFYALRIEPYLLATAEKHLALAPQIKEIAEKTLSAKIALVHGDISPKNILIGEKYPVFLDAETAWYGDPAFDAAFCLNHLLLKCAFRSASAKEYLNSFFAFADSYLNEVNWESPNDIESRIAKLLPILMLARIDGKSPVEYITNEETKNLVRQIAQRFIQNPQNYLAGIAQAFKS